MTHWTSFAGVSLVALSLAVPNPAWAQARSRGSDSSSTPSSGSSGGDSGSRSGGGDSGGARSAPQGGGNGSARPRSGSASGGSGGGSSASSGGSQTSATRGGSSEDSSGGARARGGQASHGQAQARPAFGPPSRPRPNYVIRSYDPWYGYYDPWYGYGYGYGYNRWNRYPYAIGYGIYGMPYFYDPYMSYGYGGYGGGSYSRDDGDDDRAPRQPTGMIRFRANPKHARVYVDGALVGTVDEFDGLNNHLEIEAGRHQIELRADGYQSHTSEIAVRADRTVTERASLKKLN